MGMELLGNATAWTGFALARAMLQNPEIADAYDSLLNDLRLARPLASDAAVNSILVTSTEPGEGKSSVSSCLAITASLAGQRVLLIDGDLRRSTLGAAVGSSDAVGLIEVLLGEAEAAEVIRPVKVSTDSPRTRVVGFMPGGRKPPIFFGAVDWRRAGNAFHSLSREFDVVFLDSPPVLAANDALLFASMVDAVLLVVGAGTANLDEVRRAREQLDSIRAPIIGAVLNRFDPKVHGPSNRPYSGYYRRSRP